MSFSRRLTSSARTLSRRLAAFGKTKKEKRTRRLFIQELEARLNLSTIDLTTVGASGTVNGAIVFQASPASGTGLIDPFLRIQASNTEQGYNSARRPVQFNETSNAQYNRALPLSAIPVVTVRGTQYRQFLLDVNENTGASTLFVDKIQFFVSASSSITNYPTFNGQATKIYDLDSNEDNAIKLNAAVTSGSGTGDMIMLIPNSAFTSVTSYGSNPFVSLYNQNSSTEGGFEEWSVGANGKPLPPIGEIHGYAFNDLNRDGADNSEPRLAGITVYLDANNNGVMDSGEVANTTSATGEYAFFDLYAGGGDFGTYHVREIIPAGYVQTAPAVQPNVVLNQHGQVAEAYLGQVTLATGQTALVMPNLAFGNSANQAPVATDDVYSTDEDAVLTVASPGVKINDSDPNGDAFVVSQINGSSSVGAPVSTAHGTVTLNSDGSFSYTPAPNYNGTDSFTYRVTDVPNVGVPATSNLATVTITIGAINDAPLAFNDAYSTAEDTPLAVAAPGVLGNDTDIDSATLTAVLVSGPSHGTLTLNADGSFIYTPVTNYNGPDSFTYKANDGSLVSNTATVTITITPTNDPPVANDDNYSTNEDTPLVVAALGVIANDTDVDANPLTAILVSGPTHGTLTLNSNGSFSYTPVANYNGPDSFTYKAHDGALDSNVATVSITVTAVNDAPEATNDSYTATEDVTLSISAPGVLGNDTDLDGDSLSAILVSGPTHGTLTLNADGSFAYTPDANYFGPDSFTYKANDGTLDSNVATVSLEVTAVNDAPQAANDSYVVTEDATLTVVVPGVLGNDSDSDTAVLTAVLVSGPSHGTLILNADGSFTYTPGANYNGPDSFTYKANDGSLDSNIATVSITVSAVNDAPVAADNSYSVSEDTTLVIGSPGVLANDADIDGDALSAVLVSGPSHGSLTLNADGSFSYTPVADYIGPDSFTYQANDGSLSSNTATVTISVGGVNDAPVAANDSYTTAEDTPLAVGTPGVLGNDTDVDGNSLTSILVSGPTNGTLTLNANGSFNYAPNANFSGTDAFTYKANDGSLDSNVATVSITVTAVNDAPVAVADSYSTAEDTPLTVAAPGVLANDADVDGNSLTSILVSGPSNGTLTLNADGSFSYIPNANFNGADAFSYKANDGSLDSNVAIVSITVTAVNDAPLASDQSVTTAEDTAKAVTLVATDVDGDSLTYTVVAQPAHGTLSGSGANLTYTPAANYYGPDSFTFQANDGSLDSNIATVTITVTPVNDAPAASDDSYVLDEDNTLVISAPGVLANDMDIDGDSLTAVLVTPPSHGTLTLNSDGSFTYTPAANYSGPDSFSYQSSDGNLNSNVATVSLFVTSVNDAPLAAGDAYSTAEDTPLAVSAPGVLGNDTDVDGDSLSAVLVSGPTHGTLSFNADGSFNYTPAPDYNGPDSFTYQANDGALSSSVATVSITVTAVNDAPLAANDAYSTAEDTPLTVAAPGVLGNDTDIDSATLTAILVSGPTHGTLALNADGSFTYTPAANYNGPDSFTYQANDGALSSNVAVVSISVTAVNDAPADIQLDPDTDYVIDENDLFVVDASFTDSDSTSFTVVINWGPGEGTTTLTPADVTFDPLTGRFYFDASHRYLDDNPTGTGSDFYPVSITVTDDLAASGGASTGVTVNNVTPTVSIGTGTITLSEGDGFIRPGSLTDPGTLDTFAATVNYGDGSGPQTVTIGANQTFSLSHIYADNGAYTVIVTISDDDGGLSTKSFLVTVTNVAPTVSVVGSQTARTNQPLVLNPIASFTDPGFDNLAGGTQETFTYSINWGDNSSNSGSVTNVTSGSAGFFTTGSLNASHVYSKKGTYTVAVTITDDDGGASTRSFSVTVLRSALEASSVPASSQSNQHVLTLDLVAPILSEALARWRAAGVDETLLAGSSQIEVRIADLPGSTLGLADDGIIALDVDAAGWGWFVDPTPDEDHEFLPGANTAANSTIDLLSVLAHELGHLLGLEHSESEDVVMHETLEPGERHVPTAQDFANSGLPVLGGSQTFDQSLLISLWPFEQIDLILPQTGGGSRADDSGGTVPSSQRTGILQPAYEAFDRPLSSVPGTDSNEDEDGSLGLMRRASIEEAVDRIFAELAAGPGGELGY